MSKVLVVDDSALMRRLIAGVLRSAGHQVETAPNGAEGLRRLIEWQPDVVTLDINMPEMDGLTALSLMMQARPTPVVMVSSLTERGAQATFEALALGAVDFIAKPGGTISLNIDAIRLALIDKVGAAARSKLRRRAPPRAVPPAAPPARAPRSNASVLGRPSGLVLIGVSTGGPRTLEEILPLLPADFPWPVLVSQHMPGSFTGAFARRIDQQCRLAVRECTETMALEPGHIYIAHGGGDMVVVERMGRLAIQPRPETPGHPWHPSVDVMVDSALMQMPAAQLIGVQLTGMGYDGARAMTDLKQRGGRTIAESEATSVVFGMPAELIERGGASVVLPCGDIARQLVGWVCRRELTPSQGQTTWA